MKVTIYTKDDCPSCINAKRLAKEHGMDITEIKLHRDLDRNEFLAAVEKATGGPRETVPQVILDGTYIGGFDDFNLRMAQ